jgi:hypothetical protein
MQINTNGQTSIVLSQFNPNAYLDGMGFNGTGFIPVGYTYLGGGMFNAGGANFHQYSSGSGLVTVNQLEAWAITNEISGGGRTGLQGMWGMDFSITQDNPCALMATNLGAEIDSAVKSLGGIERITSHQQINSLVANVNSVFTRFYVGKEVTDSQGATVQPPPFGGPGGFRPEFIDSIDPNEDQTHHFAGYFNAGILGRSLAAFAHKWKTDYLDADNKGDRALGDLAYAMGASLNTQSVKYLNRTNPRYPVQERRDEPVSNRLNRVLGIADRIRNEVCVR